MFRATHLHSALIEIRANGIARAVEMAREESKPGACNPYSVFVVGSPAGGWLAQHLRGGRTQRSAA
jgi:hypothetical protein